MAVVALSQGLAAVSGVRYDASQLVGTARIPLLNQLADPALLQQHLLQTIFFLHTQPPLFSLTVGLVLKFSPFTTAVSFQILSLLLAALAALALFDCAVQLGANRAVAIAIGVVVMSSSDVLLYSNWSSYDWFCAVDLVICAAGLVRWLRYRQLWLGYAVFAGAATALVLTRTLYPPIWLVVVLALSLVGGRRLPHFRGALVLGGVALGLVGLLVVKNIVLFGVPGLSSWTWFDASDATVKQLPAKELSRLTASGDLNRLWDLIPGTPASAQTAFVPWSEYEQHFPHCRPTYRGVPILDEQQTSSGAPNFNYQCYLEASTGFMHDDLAALRADPLKYLSGQFDGSERSLAPASIYPFLNETGNASHIAPYDRWYRRIVLLEIPFPRLVHSPSGDLGPPFYDHMGSFPQIQLTILLAGAVIVVQGVRQLRRRRLRDPTAVFDVFAAFTVAWTFVVGNALDFGENNRFHLDAELLMLLLLGLAIERAWRRVAQRQRGSAAHHGASRNRSTAIPA